MFASFARSALVTPRLPGRWILPLLAEGRGPLLATGPVIWLGLALLPDIYPSLRLPVWLTLAAIVGIGSEIAAHAVGSDAAWRRGWGTFWFVPAGTALLAVIWFSVFPDRPRSFAPVAVLAVLGTMMVQRLELTGPRTLRAGAHAISIGLAFALAFVAYTTAAHVAAPWALALVAAATAFAALTLLRDVRASRVTALGLVGATVVIVTELGFVLAGGPTAPWMCAALLVLVLYAASGASHAVLDLAPRHVYVEVALVTAVGLVAILVGAARA